MNYTIDYDLVKDLSDPALFAYGAIRSAYVCSPFVCLSANLLNDAVFKGEQGRVRQFRTGIKELLDLGLITKYEDKLGRYNYYDLSLLDDLKTPLTLPHEVLYNLKDFGNNMGGMYRACIELYRAIDNSSDRIVRTQKYRFAELMQCTNRALNQRLNFLKESKLFSVKDVSDTYPGKFRPTVYVTTADNAANLKQAIPC